MSSQPGAKNKGFPFALMVLLHIKSDAILNVIQHLKKKPSVKLVRLLLGNYTELLFYWNRVLTELVSKMRDMQMDKSELGCLRAIVLFNPGTEAHTHTITTCHLFKSFCFFFISSAQKPHFKKVQ